MQENIKALSQSFLRTKARDYKACLKTMALKANSSNLTQNRFRGDHPVRQHNALVLMEELSVWIAEHHLKQAEAAQILMVSRPRVSDVVNKKTARFTIDMLVEMLGRVGKPVKLAIG
jgi:predicted XRE-type DNA-binding protein